MWTSFISIFRRTQKAISLLSTVALLSPLLPFGAWLVTQSEKRPSKIGSFMDLPVLKVPPYPKLDEGWFALEDKKMEQFIPDFEGELFCLGVNMRPDRRGEEALIAFKGDKEGTKMVAAEPLYLGLNEAGKWGFTPLERASFQAIYKGGELEVSLLGNRSLRKVVVPAKKSTIADSPSWKLTKEQVSRWKYLGVDRVKEFLGKPGTKTQVRLFDGAQQRLIVLTLYDLFFLKNGRVKFIKNNEALGENLCKLQSVMDHAVQITVWDSEGFSSDTLSIPIEKGEKMGGAVQKLFQGAKPFGYQAIWMKNPLKIALYVGDWLLQEGDKWLRPSKERLEEALEGRIKGALLYFSSMKKEGGKWVAEIEVFDNLHLQKETLRIPLENKGSSAMTTRPVAKEPPQIEKKETKKEKIPNLPGAIDPMFDDFDEEVDLENYL
ncbi:MAG: hypothetical protein ACOYK9_02115 [Chlamydiia bacterium]